jgi:hypothetical protein
MVSRPTAERLTEAAGAAYVAQQTAEVVWLEREAPEAPAGADKLFLSVDGAMVPLVGGQWAEVKTMVIGEIEPTTPVVKENAIHTRNHSYFSRLTDSETFQRLALVETQRRGVENAGMVAAVTDGSEWIQKFIDHHREDAVRVLDFPHAAEHINAIGQAHWGEGSAQGQQWLSAQLHQLKHDGPEPVMTEVRRVLVDHPNHSEMATHVAYLEKRIPHMQYPTFQASGWPIGDGAVESANKLVVEARLKGSGMHWARAHVDPMLALRNIVCSDRWEEAWPQITTQLRKQAKLHRSTRRQQRRAANLVSATPADDATTASRSATRGSSSTSPASLQPDSKEPWRPAPNHPWRHMPIGRARFKQSSPPPDAKT